MADETEEIGQLRQRYGKHDYPKLSAHQRAFLLARSICDHRCGGMRTVKLEKITKGGPLVLKDIARFVKQENNISAKTYAGGRLATFMEKRYLVHHEKQPGNETYKLTLEDYSEIQIQFATCLEGLKAD